MSMHPDVEEAIDQIDAAVFSGDTFRDDDDRASLQARMDSWQREFERIETDLLHEYTKDGGSCEEPYVDEFEDADWIDIHEHCPFPNQPITARIMYQDKLQIVKGARSGDESGVVLFDFYSGTGAGTIVDWRPRTLPNRKNAHPYTGIENSGLG